MSEVQCPTCDRDDFDTTSAMRIHHTKTHNESISDVTLECDQCSGDFQRAEHNLNDNGNSFCSQHCYMEHLSSKRVEESCEWCGEDVERTEHEVKNRENVFCSTECVASFQSKNREGDWSHLWEGGVSTVEEICENCGCEIKISRWRKEQSDIYFCDNECHTEYRSIESPDQPDYFSDRWRDLREQCLERDNYKCQVCAMGDGEHKKEYGRGLNVHHIIPHRKFDSREVADRLENLVVLCSSCHRKVEEGVVKPTLDDARSATAAPDDAVVLAEKLGLPYDDD